MFCEILGRLLLALARFEVTTSSCELVFALSKYPTPFCRRFILSAIPALLDESWRRGWFEGTVDDELLPAIDTALLACYKHDLSVNPLPFTIRICPISKPSIYHEGVRSKQDLFPYNVIEHSLELPSFSENITAINDYNRLTLTGRLCHAVQDLFTELPPHSCSAYSSLLAK